MFVSRRNVVKISLAMLGIAGYAYACVRLQGPDGIEWEIEPRYDGETLEFEGRVKDGYTLAYTSRGFATVNYAIFYIFRISDGDSVYVVNLIDYVAADVESGKGELRESLLAGEFEIESDKLTVDGTGQSIPIPVHLGDGSWELGVLGYREGENDFWDDPIVLSRRTIRFQSR